MFSWKVLAVCVAAAQLTGCATVIRGRTDQIQIHSQPDGATATTSLGQSCVTPCTLTVDRKEVFNVHFEKSGFVSQDIDVKTQVGGAGAASFAGNIVLGGAIGMGTDAITGAALDHVPNPVEATLTPEPSAPKPRGKSKLPKPAVPAPAAAKPGDNS